jgi:hypothetical protein
MRQFDSRMIESELMKSKPESKEEIIKNGIDFIFQRISFSLFPTCALALEKKMNFNFVLQFCAYHSH